MSPTRPMPRPPPAAVPWRTETTGTSSDRRIARPACRPSAVAPTSAPRSSDAAKAGRAPPPAPPLAARRERGEPPPHTDHPSLGADEHDAGGAALCVLRRPLGGGPER